MKRDEETEMYDLNTAPSSEPERTTFFMEMARQLVADLAGKKGSPLTCCVVTFGCQMNARDSEKIRGILTEIGFLDTKNEEADFVLYNTCTVRENANNKVYGRLGVLRGYQKKNPFMRIALCGCMMQEAHVVEKLQESYSFVNLIFGTHNLYRFPELFTKMLLSDRMVVEILPERERIVEDLPSKRTYPFKSGVNIMFGCNNFCSYCIVPYVRGREVSREPKEILREIEALAADGVKEVMLLGQNVNSYGKNLDRPVTFANLLREVAKVEGIARIRFMTSHPKDLSEDLMDVFAETEKLCPHLHLPLQSGSSRLLEKMNRHYDKAHYLSLVQKLRARKPDISLTTDIIVGFPGETEEDFLETLDVVEQVRYDSAFTFLYSKRNGTPAASFPDQIEEPVAKERFQRLLSAVQRIAAERAERFAGKTLPILVEEQNQQDPSLVTGRLANNAVVHFPGDVSLIGQIVPVKLDECKGFYYVGSRTT